MNILLQSFCFDESKSIWLRRERGLGFEEIVSAIENGQPFMIAPHPNAAKYPHQYAGEIVIGDYVYVVSFVIQDDGNIFFKTLYPSRKATKKRKIKGWGT